MVKLKKFVTPKALRGANSHLFGDENIFILSGAPKTRLRAPSACPVSTVNAFGVWAFVIQLHFLGFM